MKKAVRVIVTVLLSLAMIMSGIPCGASSDSVDFTSPVITDNPQYSYEICKPTNELNSGDIFTPVFSGEVKSGAPVISSVTANALPDDSIVIEGKGLENSTVYTYGLLQDGSSCYRRAYIVNSDNNTVTAVIDESYKYGMFLVWAENSSGMSYPVRVNAPEIDWLDTYTASQNGQVSIYGENLSYNNESEISNVYIQNYGYVEVTYVNPYKVTFKVPSDISDGSYKIYVHNGHGGVYGWSNSTTLTVDSSYANIWTGDTHTVEGTDIEAIKEAYNAASDYDTIYFPNGTYYVSSAVVVFKKVRFVGESKDGVKIIFTAEGQNNRDGFKLYTFPCAFSDITFEDSAASDISTAFIYAENNYDQSGLTIDNCNFIKCKTYSSKPVTDPTYNADDYADIENFDDSEDVAACLELSGLKDTAITNCYFFAPKSLDAYSMDGLIVTNNTAYGNWILDYENGPCFVQVVSGERIDISENGIYGADMLTDPDGELEDFDRTFCRSIVIHAHRGPVNGVYMADNDLDRVGSYISNSGEQILLENNTIIYKGNPVSANGTTVNLANTEWTENSDGSVTGVLVNTDAAKWENTQNVIGATAVITYGDGSTQYRKIVDATADSITVEKPWDITPTSANVIMIINAYEDVVFYRNRVNGPLLYRSQYNASTAIQAWANMVDFRVVDNDISRFDYGIVCTPHYNTSNIDSYNVLEDTIISGNKIEDTRYGIGMWLMFEMAEDDFSSTEADSYIVQNAIIRRNSIDTTRTSAHENITGGGDGITVGTVANIYVEQWWDDIKICQGEWIKNTVVENNVFSNMQTSNIRMQYHQGGTIVRDNVYDENVTEISYDSSDKANAPAVYSPIVYTTPASSDSMIVEVGNSTEEPPTAPTDEYGTYEGGIDKNAGSVTPTATFMNGDFSEGLRYWGYFSTDGDLSTLAAIETEGDNSYVKVTKPADKQWLGIQSVPFGIDGLKNGDQLIVHFDYKSENPQFEANLTSINTTTHSQTSNGGHQCNNSITTPVGWRGSLIPAVPVSGLEEGATAYFQLDFRFRDGDAKYDNCFDNIQVFILREDTPDGCYETLDGGYVNSSTHEEVIIRTFEESGYFANGRKNQTEGFLNSDFSEGLAYWGTHMATDKYAMDNAQVVTENGNSYLEITTKQAWEGVESAAFSVEGLENGDMVAVLVDYKLSGTDTGYCADLYLVSGGTQIGSEGRQGRNCEVKNKAVNDGWTSAISTFVPLSGLEEGVLPRFTVTLRNSDVTNEGTLAFDNVRLVILRNDISEDCIETLDGELLNRETLWPYYGTEEDGAYVWDSNNNKNMLSVKAPEGTNLFDFENNGLKYWGASYFSYEGGGSAGYASDFAKVENGNIVVGGADIKAGEGVCSATIQLPEALADKDWHLKFDYQNTSASHVIMKYNDLSEANNSVNLNPTEEGAWATEELKLTYSNGGYFTFTASADGVNATIKNLSLVYADEGGIEETYVNIDGTPYNYEMGDANADREINIIDLVRAKKYGVDKSVKIYLAAVNFNGDFTVNAKAITSLRRYLIEK